MGCGAEAAKMKGKRALQGWPSNPPLPKRLTSGQKLEEVAAAASVTIPDEIGTALDGDSQSQEVPCAIGLEACRRLPDSDADAAIDATEPNGIDATEDAAERDEDGDATDSGEAGDATAKAEHGAATEHARGDLSAVTPSKEYQGAKDQGSTSKHSWAPLELGLLEYMDPSDLCSLGCATHRSHELVQQSDVWFARLDALSPSVGRLARSSYSQPCLQLASRAAKQPRLSDYVFCVDITQKDRPVFSGVLYLSAYESSGHGLSADNRLTGRQSDLRLESKEYAISYSDNRCWITRDLRCYVRLADLQGRVVLDLNNDQCPEEGAIWDSDIYSCILPDFIQMGKILGQRCAEGHRQQGFVDAEDIGGVAIGMHLMRMNAYKAPLELSPPSAAERRRRVKCEELSVQFNAQQWRVNVDSPADVPGEVLLRTLLPMQYFSRNTEELQAWLFISSLLIGGYN